MCSGGLIRLSTTITLRGLRIDQFTARSADEIRKTLFCVGFTYEQNDISCAETQATSRQADDLANNVTRPRTAGNLSGEVILLTTTLHRRTKNTDCNLRWYHPGEKERPQTDKCIFLWMENYHNVNTLHKTSSKTFFSWKWNWKLWEL